MIILGGKLCWAEAGAQDSKWFNMFWEIGSVLTCKGYGG